jgi:hypothetical protein
VSLCSCSGDEEETLLECKICNKPVPLDQMVRQGRALNRVMHKVCRNIEDHIRGEMTKMTPEEKAAVQVYKASNPKQYRERVEAIHPTEGQRFAGSCIAPAISVANIFHPC